MRNLWEILSGQHRTNAMDEFVNSVKAIEQQWVSVLGRKCLSAGFQDKESKPQVHIRIHPYRLKNHLKLVNGVG